MAPAHKRALKAQDHESSDNDEVHNSPVYASGSEDGFPSGDEADSTAADSQQESLRSDSAMDDEEQSDVDSEPDLEVNSSRPTTHLSQLRQIPFGTLAQAQSTLPTTARRKPRKASHAEPSEALQSIRDRLADIKAAKVKNPTANASKRPHNSAKPSRRQRSPSDASSDSDAPLEAKSKHAPMSQSSTRPVSRKRAILPELSQNPTHARDPRFHASVSGYVDQDAVARNYSFLNSYQQSELSTLKAALKSTKSADDREHLQRRINSMGNKLKASAAKEREKELLREVRKKEREGVRQGKRPFFMKKGEIKKKVREEMLGKLTEKEREKRDEKREKKRSGKELRRKPSERRRPLG